MPRVSPPGRERRSRRVARERGGPGRTSRRQSRNGPEAQSHRRLAAGALLCLAFVAASLGLAWFAIPGEFLSDDHFYIVHNSYVQGLTVDNLRAILDPWGAAAARTLNYAPVHLLAHAVEWEVFGGEDPTGWRVVNAVAHGLTSALLVSFLLHFGVPRRAAVLGGALFLVHPANLEVLAWVFQLKTILSLALALGALIFHPRRPALAAGLFGLSLLTKITGVFALPGAVVLAWMRSRSRDEAPRWGWLAVWVVLFALVAVPEMAAFQRQDDPRLVIHEDPLVHARTVVAIAARYLVMAATSHGVSTFHEPPPALSWLDPWWLGGLAALGLLGWRTVVTLWRGQAEAAMWVLAAAAFAPVSQVFPFVFPMADRYLYTILPGLIGGVLLAGHAALQRGLDSPATPSSVREALRRVPLAAGVAGLLLVVVFTTRSAERAPVFRTNLAMMQDAARHYPDGMQAHLLRGHAAASQGDAERATRAFRRAVELGFTDLEQLVENPQLQPLKRHPGFRALLAEIATRNIARLRGPERPTQVELRELALAYSVRGDLAAAIRSLERALEEGGPYDASIRAELEELRRIRAGQERASAGSG